MLYKHPNFCRWRFQIRYTTPYWTVSPVCRTSSFSPCSKNGVVIGEPVLLPLFFLPIVCLVFPKGTSKKKRKKKHIISLINDHWKCHSFFFICFWYFWPPQSCYLFNSCLAMTERTKKWSSVCNSSHRNVGQGAVAFFDKIVLECIENMLRASDLLFYCILCFFTGSFCFLTPQSCS